MSEVSQGEPESTGHLTDSTTYDANALATWAALSQSAHSIWRNDPFWRMMFRLSSVSFIATLLVFCSFIDPAGMDPAKFNDICTFLNYFLATLLAFFISMSIRRWYSCAAGFLTLVDAVRSLQMQLVSLGVPADKLNLCLRYGALSARLLDLELRAEAAPPSKKTRSEILREVWLEIDRRSVVTQCKYINADEKRILQKTANPSAVVWVWISSVVGRMSQDGEMPPMHSPTYARVMLLATEAQSGIREVRASTSVQTPYVYVHMLATLLHVNNLLNALTFGLTSGVALAKLVMSHWGRMYSSAVQPPGELTQDFQVVVISMFTRGFGPAIYLALFQMCICICCPFSSSEGNIHTDAMVMKLERNLQDGHVVAAHPPHWEQPHYKV